MFLTFRNVTFYTTHPSIVYCVKEAIIFPWKSTQNILSELKRLVSSPDVRGRRNLLLLTASVFDFAGVANFVAHSKLRFLSTDGNTVINLFAEEVIFDSIDVMCL